MAVFTDPEGAAFCVWQAKEFKGAQVVNEPGSLNFNGLNTRDVEGAKSFYGSVFGWETLGSEGGFEMWTLPGYGDYLERDDPDIRKRVAEVGGPTGIRGRRGEHQPDRGRPARRPGALERDVRSRRRRRHREEADGARRQGGRPAVRCPVGPDDGHRRSRRARPSSRASSCPRTRTSAARRTPPSAPPSDEFGFTRRSYAEPATKETRWASWS